MAKAFHSLLRRGSVILHPAVPPAMAKVGCSAASPRPARERDSHSAVAADFFVVRSLPEFGPFAFPSFGPCRFQIDLVTVDRSTVAVGLFDPVGPDHSVAGFVVAAADFVRLSSIADSACLVCSSAAATGKEKVGAPVVSCFLVPRFSSLR